MWRQLSKENRSKWSKVRTSLSQHTAFSQFLLTFDLVMDLLEAKGFFPSDFVVSETTWFYNMLGIDDMYFQTEGGGWIVTQIRALDAARGAGCAREDKRLESRLDEEDEGH